MSTYMVMAPPDVKDPAASPEAAERMVFIADRFSWFAFFFSLIYLLWHRMWLVLLGYLVIATGLELLLAAVIGGATPAVAALAISLLFAFEANGLRRWTLEQRGWRMLAVACGGDIEEAELRFFRGLEHRQTEGPQTPPPLPGAATIIPRIGTEHVVGLTLGQETQR